VLLIVGLALLAAGLLAVAYGVFVERRWYRVGRYRVAILPAGASGLRVLHLSDLHLTATDDRARRFVASLPEPDVTVVTGDILGEPEAVEHAVETLRPVRGRVASLFVLGSNDLYAPKPLNPLRYFIPNHKRKRRHGQRGRGADLVRALEADGWVHLKNRKLDVEGLDMEIVGLDDPHIHRGDIRVAPREGNGRVGLAVVHSPDPAPELVAMGYDLVVAGHTHGGQVRMPLAGALVSNSSIPPRLARGLIRIGDGYLHVSPGMGTSKFAPFRFLCRPEATILDLEPADQPVEATRS
jgi:predicted MPP superfamily phosphohydrolase